MEAQNQILLDDKVGGKGKFFTTRFLQAGLVKYSFGVCLLDKETIDKFIYNFVGCPVIINHKDVTNTSAKDDRVGVISRIWFNEQDGWYWGEGVIFEQEALDLIDKGYNVSCQYEITEYSSTGGIHNGNEYDKTILNGKPEHLAIVENPRYENAMIAINAMEIEEMEAINEDKKEFVTVGEGESAHAIPIDYLKKDKKETTTKQADKKAKEEEAKKNNQKYYKEETAKVTSNRFNKLFQGGSIEDNQFRTTKKISDKEQITFDKKRNQVIFYKQGDLSESKDYNAPKGTVGMLETFRTDNYNKLVDYLINERKEEYRLEASKQEPKKQETTQLKLFSKNDIIQAINEIKGLDMFKNLFRKKEKNMDREEIKEIMMECLTELTASNEADKKDEPDYKKMYEDLKAECEAKAKNEEKEEDIEEEKEEVVENKCDKAKAKNEIEAQKEAMMSEVITTKSTYITQSKARELGKELF